MAFINSTILKRQENVLDKPNTIENLRNVTLEKIWLPDNHFLRSSAVTYGMHFLKNDASLETTGQVGSELLLSIQ